MNISIISTMHTLSTMHMFNLTMHVDKLPGSSVSIIERFHCISTMFNLRTYVLCMYCVVY